MSLTKHTPAPLHASAPEQPLGFAAALQPVSAFPDRTLAQVPLATPVRLRTQAWQRVPQALLQQTLSTQLPLTQSAAVPHVEP